MTGRASSNNSQNGAALIVVLLLVATLSFILLSVTNVVTAGVQRAESERTRSELLWRAAAAEQIVRAILTKAAAAGAPPKMAPGEGLFAEQLELPFANGKGSVIFEDATRCFNVNSLVTDTGGTFAEDAASKASFILLMESIGLGGGEAQTLADVIVDFLDTDISPGLQGAEDGLYTALPTPYRTPDHPVASLSELRAMDGITREIFLRIRPYLCALSDTAQPPVNINMVLEPHSLLLSALVNGAPTPAEFKTLIEARPPGGFADIAAATAAGWPAIPNASVGSTLIEARIRLEVNDRTMEETLLFGVSGTGPPVLRSRTFGADP